jgi:hypothetical protein
MNHTPAHTITKHNGMSLRRRNGTCSVIQACMSLIIQTWVVGTETDGNPAAGGHTDGVALDGVDEVVLGRVLRPVEVVEPLPDDVEVEAVEMQRMALGAEDAGVLHHQLHAGAERQHHHLGPVHHVGVVRRRPRVVERHERVVGEV